MKQNVALSKQLIRKLARLKSKLPEEVFTERVSPYGPRETWNAVIDWVIDTNPIAIQMLGSTEDDTGNGS